MEVTVDSKGGWYNIPTHLFGDKSRENAIHFVEIGVVIIPADHDKRE